LVLEVDACGVGVAGGGSEFREGGDAEAAGWGRKAGGAVSAGY
jgi:hypothetical protein